MNEQWNEAELLDLASRGNREAFTRLYTQYIHMLNKYICSICLSGETSSEILQDLFLKLWENRESLRYVTSFKAYLYRSAKNALLNHLKKEQAEARHLDAFELRAANFSEAADERVIYRDYEKAAHRAINLLPKRRKEIFELHLNENLSLNEIALKLRISKSVVKKQLYSGMSFVRKYLYDYDVFILLVFSIGCLTS